MTENATERARLEANKKLVLDMWYAFVNGRDVSKAAKYIAEDYIQHNPNAQQGLKGVVDYHRAMWPEGPRAPGSFALTKFDAVIAEGDLVQLMFRRQLPCPDDPSKTYEVYWFDLYRVRDGKIVEHWDSALKE